ncbi:inner membrane protein [Wigglesworthia glossinidia endosymbiont of Glossina morsitans morsitans (Yale colony)]|uniref:Inner membrane protein n=1 Tax=Wigglesworthia glossinidia endosymbiont of Glossina morsitans morsitans (Yale colony) TaxID=1142511 RepID=H6Q4K7_WIGGL|nr:Bax inhibitor-1 family protein [Wigglesworthia glossinidia]AFA41067.1 inner membrane protein [Wigglesworthia glossinidia endosymbiont of Glossina morsitans morsitans (Yale colony)]
MNRSIEIFSHSSSRLSTYKVLRNTYLLLSITVAFSATVATVSSLCQLPFLGAIPTLIGFYTLLFLVNYLSDKKSGILATFALTGFMGYAIAPLISIMLAVNSSSIILALSGTAMVFFCCSIYSLKTNRNLSFLSSVLISGSIALLICTISNMILNMSALSMTISIMFIIFSSVAIIWEINNIIFGGEKNYIRATVSLYVSIYNIFSSFLGIFGGIKK